ncbi:S24 family peptidase [Campylobacter curvus]|uniref:Peptidase S24 LexA-like protein n=1 Tax=Campylobacter curvus (strain 525.92) TaxID=360105 RepID=A7H0W0_CAMC5|nr:S24 family peptidase [Campylobacter curvus]EAU00368.1 peptidase S24 LexA-like protein [Campylobacter curvus 525.92]
MDFVFNVELAKKKIKELSYTYSDLVNVMGENGDFITESAIKKWFMKNNPIRPTIENIQALSKAIKVPLNELVEQTIFENVSAVKEIPVVGEASCGIPEPNSYQDYDQKTYCSADIWNEDIYAVIASGDSMYDLIERGDEVICDPRADILSGDIVHYEFNGESAIKVYFKEEKFGVVRFVPYNRSGEFKTLSFSVNDEALQNIKMVKVIKVNKSMENNRKSRLRAMGLI